MHLIKSRKEFLNLKINEFQFANLKSYQPCSVILYSGHIGGLFKKKLGNFSKFNPQCWLSCVGLQGAQ